MFESIFSGGSLPATGFFIALAVALVCGGAYAFLSCYGSGSSASFAVAVTLLPMSVAAVIALGNGNLGVGVAIAGAFGLVRFRSAPGTAREIAVIFIAMAAGLAFGMGYLAYGVIFLFGTGAVLFGLGRMINREKRAKAPEKLVKITIPESLDYTTVFDDIFLAYTKNAELESVKSTNMGSMFRLTYRVTLKDSGDEKAMLDALRTRNGNLEIQSSRADLAERDL